ncbi:uncharacterized protein LOC124363541 [Homalodisca vitripennis]|uniref:uncharacterized protein LOC124363541 n=1 Tax=Homalodisca vitripennis TaxID=197043 RepID=UPI001EECC5FE|nr:uncharacterized protein LOC124363541 [Homalodisca vitripennis]
MTLPDSSRQFTMNLITVLGLLCLLVSTEAANETEALLSRRKRYLTFPEGSTYSFAFCMELKTVTQDIDIFTEGVAVSANYDLPSKPELLFTSKPIPPAPILQRRHRRDLYSNVERILNLAGLDGRSCVLLAVCEASQRLTPGIGLLEEIVRILFKMPVEQMSRDEPHEHWQYSTAYSSGTYNLDCQKLYPRCPLSLLSIVMDMKPASLVLN